MTSNPDELMTLSQTAAWFRVDEEVLREQAEGGGIPARKLGGEWYFSRAAIQEWFRSSFVEKPRPRPAEPIDGATSKRNLLAAARSWKDEPIEDLLAELQAARRALNGEAE